jgi:hypothetical protein
VVACDNCNANGGYYGGADSTQPHEAIAAWNTRAAVLEAAAPAPASGIRVEDVEEAIQFSMLDNHYGMMAANDVAADVRKRLTRTAAQRPNVPQCTAPSSAPGDAVELVTKILNDYKVSMGVSEAPTMEMLAGHIVAVADQRRDAEPERAS